MTLDEMKRIVVEMKEREVGTIFVAGDRSYVWIRGKGWVKPGPHKAAMRKRLAKR